MSSLRGKTNFSLRSRRHLALISSMISSPCADTLRTHPQAPLRIAQSSTGHAPRRGSRVPHNHGSCAAMRPVSNRDSCTTRPRPPGFTNARQHVDVPVPNLHCDARAVAKSELTCFFPAPSLRFNHIRHIRLIRRLKQLDMLETSFFAAFSPMEALLRSFLRSSSSSLRDPSFPSCTSRWPR